MSPIIVGGNGHSGTRIFAEILLESGVHMGVAGVSYDRKSKDLNIRGLMNRWMKPYLLGLDPAEKEKMRKAFDRRLRILIPHRPEKWGFKNPRSMFLLPFYHEMFPDLSFIHVIRDGRDMCFGNPFVDSPTYWSFVSEEESQRLSKEERMIKFWGESNRRVRAFGRDTLKDRYLCVRFEDLCNEPERETERIVSFIDGPRSSVGDLAALVRKPKSIGRWQSFEPEAVNRVLNFGEEYLQEFGYG